MKKIFALACVICIFPQHLNAAFPEDFESGVVLVEETAVDGNARRAQGFNDGGINGNVPGLRAFLNGASVDNTLRVLQGRFDARFGRELDFVHAERGVWPNGPNNDGLNTVNGVVWVFAQLPNSDLWAGGTFEFIRRGLTERSVLAISEPRGQRLRFQPLPNLVPQEGQVLGFMVSGITRNGIAGRNNVQARTNVAFFRIGEQPGNGIQLTQEEVDELFGVVPPVAPTSIAPALVPINNMILNEE